MVEEYIEIIAQLITMYGGVVDDDYFKTYLPPKANFGVPVLRTSEAHILGDARNACIKRTMMNWIKLTTIISIFLLTLAALFSATANAQEQRKAETAKPVDIPTYKPPARGAPGGRIGGGTRGDGQTFRLSVLAPSHTGQTIQEQPVLFWYVSKAITTPVEFTLAEAGIVPPLVERALQPPFQPGIHSLRLADFGIHLEAGKVYRWFVAFVVNSKRRSKDILAGGTIERVEASSRLKSELARTPKAKMSQVYAEAGLWYDAILAVSDLIDAAPSEPDFRKQRAALLDQVGLSDIALGDVSVPE